MRAEFALRYEGEGRPAIRTILVVGGGVMGSGIALSCALAGHRVLVSDVDDDALRRAAGSIEDRRRFLVANRLADESSRERVGAIEFLLPNVPNATYGGVDMCFEAVPDNLKLKQGVVSHVLRVLPASAPVATNSGNLLVDDIAGSLAQRERVLSAHWINPPQIMPVVEVAPGTHTDPASVDRTVEILSETGKIPVRLRRDAPGRIANRLQYALMNEAIRILAEGVAGPDEIDTATTLSFMPRMQIFGLFGARDIYGRQGEPVRTLEYLRERTGNTAFEPTALHRSKAALEAAGDLSNSKWNPDALRPDREECDRRLATFLAALMADRGPGRHAPVR